MARVDRHTVRAHGAVDLARDGRARGLDAQHAHGLHDVVGRAARAHHAQRAQRRQQVPALHRQLEPARARALTCWLFNRGASPPPHCISRQGLHSQLATRMFHSLVSSTPSLRLLMHLRFI